MSDEKLTPEEIKELRRRESDADSIKNQDWENYQRYILKKQEEEIQKFRQEKSYTRLSKVSRELKPLK